jgi:hypothetical protein
MGGKGSDPLQGPLHLRQELATKPWFLGLVAAISVCHVYNMQGNAVFLLLATLKTEPKAMVVFGNARIVHNNVNIKLILPR